MEKVYRKVLLNASFFCPFCLFCGGEVVSGASGTGSGTGMAACDGKRYLPRIKNAGARGRSGIAASAAKRRGLSPVKASPGCPYIPRSV